MVILDKKGRSLKQSSRHFDIKNPFGVAVDDADNNIIYIADQGSKRLIKLNKDMNKIDTKQDSELRGLSVVGDEVMVCDNKNEFTLKNWQIEDPVHFKTIRDVSPDEHGNLYVCDRGNAHTTSF